jgi:hypothetical protein
VVALRTVRFEISHGDIAQRELGKPRVLESGRCSDEEKRLVSPPGGGR